MAKTKASEVKKGQFIKAEFKNSGIVVSGKVIRTRNVKGQLTITIADEEFGESKLYVAADYEVEVK